LQLKKPRDFTEDMGSVEIVEETGKIAF